MITVFFIVLQFISLIFVVIVSLRSQPAYVRNDCEVAGFTAALTRANDAKLHKIPDETSPQFVAHCLLAAGDFYLFVIMIIMINLLLISLTFKHQKKVLCQ